MATAAAEVAAETAAVAAAPVMSVDVLAGFMCRVCPVMLDVEDDLFSSSIGVTVNKRVLEDFITDPRNTVLVVKRSEIEAGDQTHVQISFELEISFGGDGASYVAVVKKNPESPLEADRSPASQLQMINIGSGSPFETLHSYVQTTFVPYFRSYMQASGKQKDGKIAGDVATVSQRMAELESSLYNCKHDVQIENVDLPINAEIRAAEQRAKTAGHALTVEDLGPIANDRDFLNTLQKGVNVWIKNVQKVTKLDRIENMPANSSTGQEVKFWLELEGALQSITEQLNSPAVQCTLNTLKRAKRYHATVAFDPSGDTIGVKTATEKVENYKVLMKDFPIDELLAATEIGTHIPAALNNIFSHLIRRAKNTSYPTPRYVALIEALARDLKEKILSLLRVKRVMDTDYKECEKLIAECRSAFASWSGDDSGSKFGFEAFRDFIWKTRKQPLRVNIDLRPLEERLDAIRKFRRQHEELKEVIVGVGARAAGGDSVSTREINDAYEQVRGVDVLDLTPQGAEQWEAAIKRYDERIDRVETQITSRLRDKLATAKNASEMFRVFSKFNALFFRPRIRGAIHEYQTQLLQRVKEDIRVLHEKFIQSYTRSEASFMNSLRDMPPVSGAIIWARQIERQLDTYMNRVEAVLGKRWELDVEGQKLKADAEPFRKKLNTDQLFEQWCKETEGRNFEVKGRLLDVVKKRNELLVDINFDENIITLFKEVRNLQWLGYRLPFSITMHASSAKRVYPFAVSLRESLRTYSQTCRRITESSALLVAADKVQVQQKLNEGFKLKWESLAKLDPFVTSLAEMVARFREKVESFLEKEEEITQVMAHLATCPLTEEAFVEIIEKVQKTVDELNLQSYSNLGHWVKKIDQQVEEMLLERLVESHHSWVSLFETESDAKERRLSPKEEQEREAKALAIKHRPKLATSVHHIAIRNQVVGCFPPLEDARASWISQLNQWLGVICGLPRIQSSRYDDSLLGGREEEQVDKTYRSLLKRLPAGMLEVTYETIEKKIVAVSKYVQIWLQYQALWDMESSMIYDRLGDDLEKWQVLLVELKQSRKTFDTSQTTKDFGPIVIDFKQVQASISNKYDFWHKDILFHFGNLLGGSMQEFYSTISAARLELEQQSINMSSTELTVKFIVLVQALKQKSPSWEAQLSRFQVGQELLRRQRFQFPADWLEYVTIEGEWNAFREILKRKDDSIASELPVLQSNIVEEGKELEKRLQEFYSDWAKGKPLNAVTSFSTALESLRIFEGRIGRLHEDKARVTTAKEALNLEPQPDDKLGAIQEELTDLKGVWNELAGLWAEVEALRETPWSAIVPRKIRRSLEDTQGKMKDLPSRMRQYSAYEHVDGVIKGYLRVNPVVNDLKSEALRERHWTELRRKLNAKWVFSELTLGELWDSDIKKHEAIYKEVIQRAQGELALEEFLKQVRESWATYELELVNYQNKCHLIKGWDDLFTKLGEHLNSISAMKASPFYKVFEEQANSWDDRLNKIRNLFDVWIDVQRRWVYLEGIFSGSADIAALLPVETQRFKSVNAEFVGIMKKVHRARLVVDVASIEGIQKTLDRTADSLTKIQKALGDYLERQRAAFPRFYFVGDEDLLEIIGNSKDIERLQKHLKKMFAGLSHLLLDEEKTTVLGMGSPEGETVMFKKVISIKDHPKINQWLTRVENEMKFTLASLFEEALAERSAISFDDTKTLLEWIEKYPAQLVVICGQTVWTHKTEKAIEATGNDPSSIPTYLKEVEATLDLLADQVLQDLPYRTRKKYEHLITELVHQRDVLRSLIQRKISSTKDFAWLNEMRFYWKANKDAVVNNLTIQMANASFFYGYEYLGVAEKLVQTPLTDRCYLALTQALESRMGGSPFGPAGTGKTETVKALGAQLGRFVIVFCCDEAFDFQAMSRIFVGLCQCGAWGCFDEFNRLEERILSAVSQQIQQIQVALKEGAAEVDIIGRNVKINQDMGVFITMNPGYAGRSNLPDNLKQLFRGIAMIQPDRELIAQVMLFSQGFKTAERLSGKIVPLFKLCKEQLSPQSHYDFGLRALKSVLVSAGNLKRKELMEGKADQDPNNTETYEQGILLQSICDNIIPKLVAEDIPLFRSLLSDVFPGAEATLVQLAALRKEIENICTECNLTASPPWIEKQLQLYATQVLRHGVMIVGPSGSGKSTAWKVLLEAMERTDGVESVSYVVDPKAISKDELFGTLDQTTREWTDGLFTHLLRKIVDNVRGEASKRHWIVFDGDVDPEWVENLNSLLDDNKLLTLPNGERLSLPDNVRIMFEVETLKYATPATVSRCGMIWFSEETVTNGMIFENYLTQLRNIPLAEHSHNPLAHRGKKVKLTPELQVQRDCAAIVEPLFAEDSVVESLLAHAGAKEHIMDFTRLRALGSMLSILNKGVGEVLEYNETHPDFPLSSDRVEKYISKRLFYAAVWGFGGSMGLRLREEFSNHVRSVATVPTPDPGGAPLLDYFVSVETGEWTMWSTTVPTLDIETDKAASPDVVIPTVDTVRHVEVLHSWLAEHKPLLLCGPPGSGKTMTLYNTLSAFPDFDVVSLNFSSATSPDLILKTFEHHCEFKRTQHGTILRPREIGKWLVVFCDEINLPQNDKYGTQKVITFLRQMTEQGGYWRTADHTWIILERVQFVGACNPPSDPGRVALSHRFLRYAPLLLVDFPAVPSLHQIYGTFARALLKLVPPLRSYAQALTHAMVDVYSQSQRHFTPDMQSHYIYSPRELSRWIRALHEAIKQSDSMALEDLVRVWAHEGLRLFQDRLVEVEEKQWTDDLLDKVANEHFTGCDFSTALARPILYSNWLTKEYASVEREALREYVQARLKVFAEEELDVNLVVFNEVLEHILRIDRVFRQPQGHALLIGVSGGGKTVLSRFVAWLNGLSIFTIKVNNRYTAEDFDEDLRTVMRLSGAQGEKICFIFDESNVLESSFLERMNTLLAGGEVPGLFEGDEYTALMNSVKDHASREGLMLDTPEELYHHFTAQVRLNLHIVFTMNPASPDFHNRAATSPALYNRCVLDWFGEWSDQALFQVGHEFTKFVDLDNHDYIAPNFFPEHSFEMALPVSHRDAVVSSLVFMHGTISEANVQLVRSQGRQNYVTPRHYLDFIGQFVNLLNEKREELEEQQLHINVGLQKLRDTQEQVATLQSSLREKNIQLEAKNKEANEKLKQMVDDQQIAEQNKKESEKLQVQLAEQNAVIETNKEQAMAQLSNVEPMVEEAKKSVSSIKKQHLDEIRALSKPPQKVRMALEAVVILLGAGRLEWKDIRRKLQERDFIPSIVKFDSEAITPRARKMLNEGFLNDPEFTFESVNRASKACGPLVKWVRAQISYSEILNSVQPLRDKVAGLEAAAASLQQKQDDLVAKITALEESIATYKQDYAILIRETEAIKGEMETVKSKVERSVSLLGNLSSEQSRWEQQSASFQEQMGTLIGDALLSSAFLAYSGFFDQQYRSALMGKWKGRLLDVAVLFNEQVSVVEYLSHPDERLTWQANKLPADDLCVENAIMMHRFNRYPLIIDPSGQAAAFLMNQYKSRKIIQTSFLDNSFMKNLESALRFGTPLLVHDVESIDPVLNPVLNKEIRKQGGRILITLGDQDVDFSPSFVIFLATRDPTAHFTPDLCSRVTFVNFTVTPSSLQSQCLHEILKTERPDIEQKRSDLLKLQGEFRVRLRSLEKSLLTALNESSGNILDDDKVMNTLTTLKNEALEIMTKVEETELVFEEITAVSAVYTPMASYCSRIFFAVEQLATVHFLYQFSLSFFLDMFHSILNSNEKLKGVQEAAARLEILTTDLFETIFTRVSRTLLHEDQCTFALRLAQIRLKGSSNELPEAEAEFFMKGGQNVAAAANLDAFASLEGLLSESQMRYLAELQTTLPSFASVGEQIVAHRSEWEEFFGHATAELQLPTSWEEHLQEKTGAASAVVQAFRRLVLLKALRPDRLVAGVQQVVGRAFGDGFLHATELDLETIVEVETAASSPLILCSMPGHDGGALIDDLAARARKQCKSIAIGSPEGYDLAEKAINAAAKAGTWVLLKNVHLAPQWLSKLEKKLHGLQMQKNFRLFMTSEIHPKLPASLLRQAQVFSFEPPPGVKANLQHSLAAMAKDRAERAPIERTRMYFMLAWFHAITQERLRYAPFGWSKMFEFGDADKRCALETIDVWLDSVAQGRDNLGPERIPWSAIRTLLGQSVYGGRVDNEFDQRLLDSFLEQFFSPACFDLAFPLVADAAQTAEGGPLACLRAPEGTKKAQFVQWVEALPENESPSWLGLSNNAEFLLLENQGKRLISRFLKMQTAELDDSYGATSAVAASSSGGSARPQWAQTLDTFVDTWTKLLPKDLAIMERTAASANDPLFRFFEREVSIGSRLLARIHTDLDSLKAVAAGEQKQTNDSRMLMTCIEKALIPEPWRIYSVADSATLTTWLVDFIRRIQQLARIRADKDFSRVWLGGLFNAEAFMTATRQAAARAHQWSLENLELTVRVVEGDKLSDDADETSFLATEMFLEGAGWNAAAHQLQLVNEMFLRMPAMQFTWKRKEDVQNAASSILLPVYLNEMRLELLFAVQVATPAATPAPVWYQRGAALVATRPQ